MFSVLCVVPQLRPRLLDRHDNACAPACTMFAQTATLHVRKVRAVHKVCSCIKVRRRQFHDRPALTVLTSLLFAVLQRCQQLENYLGKHGEDSPEASGDRRAAVVGNSDDDTAMHSDDGGNPA